MQVCNQLKDLGEVIQYLSLTQYIPLKSGYDEKSQEAFSRVPGPANYHIVILGDTPTSFPFLWLCSRSAVHTIPFPLSSLGKCFLHLGSPVCCCRPGTKPRGSGSAKGAWLFARLRGWAPLEDCHGDTNEISV